RCSGCGHVQLGYVVAREKLFHGEYAYDMSVTDAGVRHFREMADELCSRYPGTGKVLDIGSNTGVLLEGFQERGQDVLGVDPSANVQEMAEKRGVTTVEEFFDSDTAAEISQDHGRMDIITATNVLAHVADLHDTMEGVKRLLSRKGVLVIEVPYLRNLLEENQFDTVYHEHLSYFSLNPLEKLFEKHGLEMIDVEERDIHGGSLRIHVSREGERERNDRVDRFLEREEEERLHSQERMEAFREEVEENRRELRELIHGLRSEGNTVAGVGAPAKGVTLLNYCGLDRSVIPYVTEKSELKIGKYVPGTHNRVVPDRKLLEDQPDYALLLPWNFADSIMDNLQEYSDRGGKFIIPVPEPRIVE
ncbi:MAG: methyltransferase domain-containing protein, partial [Candidatus Nanohaloarchaea archaeon]